MWFESHPPLSSSPGNSEGDDPMSDRIGDVRVSEYDVEEEFWRLVQSPHETVEVEYGADVHSTTHGRYESQQLCSDRCLFCVC
jgi:histone demethylase JARID1